MHPHSKAKAKARKAWDLGRTLSKSGDMQGAADAYARAAELDNSDDLFAMNAARACLNAERLEDSLRYGRQAVQINPANSFARIILTASLDRAQRIEEMVEVLDATPVSVTRTPELWVALGDGYKRLGRYNEAINAFMSALALKIDDAKVHFYLGMAFYDVGLKEEAAECLLTASALGIDNWALHVDALLAYCERENCRWDRVRPAMQAMLDTIASLPDDAAMATCMFSHATLIADPQHQLKAARVHARTMRGMPLVKRATGAHAAGQASTGQRIRLGYLSADFHAHATSILLVEMLERHDREHFEVFLYSHGKDDKSAMRQRVIAAADHFVDVAGTSDQAVAQRIADDGIDILIDLKGYTAQNRFGVFARRPAPLQISYLGYPGTTGADFIDYIVGDPFVTPLAHAGHFSEKIAQMPGCYQPNDGQRPRPGTTSRAEQGLPADALVLCGFNQAYKISPEVLDVWCGLMTDLPGSVLWLLDWHGQARPNLQREIEARGIDAHRIFWAPRKHPAEHITRLQLADVFLDTWPTNAHTTASDALWAGVPLVTLSGQTFASRVAGSLLHAVGLDELICTDCDQYRARVLALAGDAPLRLALRERLAQARECSPLFDAQRYARAFEALLTRMQARHDAGMPSDHLSCNPAPRHFIPSLERLPS